MSPRFILGREKVPCVAEVVNRSLKANCTGYPFIPCFKAKVKSINIPTTDQSLKIYAYVYTGASKSIPIFVPDGRNCDPSLYQMAEIETHSSVPGISWE